MDERGGREGRRQGGTESGSQGGTEAGREGVSRISVNFFCLIVQKKLVGEHFSVLPTSEIENFYA